MKITRYVSKLDNDDLSQALNDNDGGILIMITDGQNNKGTWPNKGLEDRIVNENVRVITLAIG